MMITMSILSIAFKMVLVLCCVGFRCVVGRGGAGRELSGAGRGGAGRGAVLCCIVLIHITEMLLYIYKLVIRFCVPRRNMVKLGRYEIMASGFFPIIIPPTFTGFTLSVCPSVDRIVSNLYLQQYSSDPFNICASYQATSESVACNGCFKMIKKVETFGEFFKFYNFDFIFFWLGIQYDSMVWVLMRRRGYPQNADVLVDVV